MLTNDNKFKKELIEAPPTLIPNQGYKSFTMPVSTRPIPEVSTIADSLSPMTLNDTNQMPVDTSEVDHMRIATDACNTYIEEATRDPEKEGQQPTPPGLFSTPLEPYPTRGPPIACVDD